MKTILRIIVILLVAGIVSGGFYLAANNTSLASGSDVEHGQPPAMTTSTDGQTFQRPEGGDDHDSASLSRGLAGVAGTLAKLTGIAIIILLIEKAFELVNKRKLQPSSS